MSVAVIDAGIAIGLMQGRHRSQAKLDRLLRSGPDGRTELVISVVNLAEVLIHTAELSRATGVDAIALLTASRVRIHHPDEVIARRVAKLHTPLADGFAAATAQELGAACIRPTRSWSASCAAPASPSRGTDEGRSAPRAIASLSLTDSGDALMNAA